MPFNPKSLDVASLKRLAHRLHEALAEDTPSGQPAPTLARTQEILAKTFSFQNWNDAVKQTAAHDLLRPSLAQQIQQSQTPEKPTNAAAFQPNVQAVVQAWGDAPSRSITDFEQVMGPLFHALTDQPGEQVAATLQQLAQAIQLHPTLLDRSPARIFSTNNSLGEDQYKRLISSCEKFWKANISQDWWPDDKGDPQFHWTMLVDVMSEMELYPDAIQKQRRNFDYSTLNQQVLTPPDPERLKQAWMAHFSDDEPKATDGFIMGSSSMEELIHRLRTVRDLYPHLATRRYNVTSTNLPLVLVNAWKEARPEWWNTEQELAYELFRSERGASEFTLRLPPSTHESDTLKAQAKGQSNRRRSP